ncbi:hypothetical protein OH146_08180 [Salinibacterium sp. SYSU T00001]|uniref:hypothetical protein n=1 Tax=Homoserinimonas sedimenticola TaxID=2986805 RepID=UPI002236964C|nr:hypothetical protein [Salinibacterium sedimenticola]MCW4385752.1 hypothetical protein [Salinibacterium sedimenticola]
MTSGAVEEGTGPTWQPTPPPPPLTEAETKAARTRLAIIWGVAFGFLLLAFAAIVITLNSTVFSASGFVSAYLQSLSRHDIASALAMPGVTTDADASDSLLRRDALGRLSRIELVDDEDRGGGEHHVTYSYLVDGTPGRTTFVVQHTGPRLGVFSGWAFVESPLTTLEVVPRNTVEFEVNGVPVVAAAGAGQVSAFQVLVPGAYTFTHESLYLEAEATTLPVTSTSALEPFVLTASASRAFVDAVEVELAAYLDRCAEEQVLQPTGCPFGKQIANRIVGAPQWAISDYPRVEILPGEQIGTWVVPPAHGAANLTVDVMSLFDGSVSSISEDVPFTVSYIITFTADGGITLTPR